MSVFVASALAFFLFGTELVDEEREERKQSYVGDGLFLTAENEALLHINRS